MDEQAIEAIEFIAKAEAYEKLARELLNDAKFYRIKAYELTKNYVDMVDYDFKTSDKNIEEEDNDNENKKMGSF